MRRDMKVKEVHTQDDPSSRAEEDKRERRVRRTYEKPRIELHDVSRSILGNESPVAADGLSGTFRT
jgi:hypothetical protein